MRRHRLAGLLIGITALVACGKSNTPHPLAEPPLSDAQAAAALNDALSSRGAIVDAQRASKDPTVSKVFLSDCQEAAQVVCVANFDAGDHWTTRVAFWKTPNPRHPWRAMIVGERP